MGNILRCSRSTSPKQADIELASSLQRPFPNEVRQVEDHLTPEKKSLFRFTNVVILLSFSCFIVIAFQQYEISELTAKINVIQSAVNMTNAKQLEIQSFQIANSLASISESLKKDYSLVSELNTSQIPASIQFVRHEVGRLDTRSSTAYDFIESFVILMAGIFTVISVLLTGIQMYRHIENKELNKKALSELSKKKNRALIARAKSAAKHSIRHSLPELPPPAIEKRLVFLVETEYTVNIILAMAPLFAVTSLFNLCFMGQLDTTYISTIQDFYESIVIYVYVELVLGFMTIASDVEILEDEKNLLVAKLQAAKSTLKNMRQFETESEKAERVGEFSEAERRLEKLEEIINDMRIYSLSDDQRVVRMLAEELLPDSQNRVEGGEEGGILCLEPAPYWCPCTSLLEPNKVACPCLFIRSGSNKGYSESYDEICEHEVCFGEERRYSKLARAQNAISTWIFQTRLLAMQFVVFRPLLPLLGLIDVIGPLLVNYGEFITVSLAVWAMLNLYHGSKNLLELHNTWEKLLCIKGVVFLTYYQSFIIANVLIPCLNEIGYGIGAPAETFQNFLICFEMCIASLVHRLYFSVDEWKQDYEDNMRRKREMEKDYKVNVLEVFADIHQKVSGVVKEVASVGIHVGQDILKGSV